MFVVWVLGGLAGGAGPVLAAAPPAVSNYFFSTLAGRAGAGWHDGPGPLARLHYPSGVALDAAGALYVADYNNHTIRKRLPSGEVATLAGMAGVSGIADGRGAAARFNSPYAVAVDGAGIVYVADQNNHTLRRITPGGDVTTLAGRAGSMGSADGSGAAARFAWPAGVAVDSLGNICVADTYNGTVRRVTPGGAVTTLAGVAGGFGSQDGQGAAAQFAWPSGLGADGFGNLYVGDSFNHTIRKVTSTGNVTTLAGAPGWAGYADGAGGQARFNYPYGLAVDAAGWVYVADYSNHAIRKISPEGGVSTLAGQGGVAGSVDGLGSEARFNSPYGLAATSSGRLYVGDRNNHLLRLVETNGQVITLAGMAGNSGTADGTGAAAQFRAPSGLAAAPSGDVYVADTYNHTIRKIGPGGEVATLAGQGGDSGGVDGPAAIARFNLPRGVAAGSNGLVYVADTANHAIRQVDADGQVSTLAGLPGSSGSADETGGAARFNSPCGIAAGPDGFLYVADRDNHTIRKISPEGQVSTLAGLARSPGAVDDTGPAARFNRPAGIAVDASGTLYVADQASHTIRKVTPEGAVSTLAGQAGALGSADGVGNAARFYNPSGVAVDDAGFVYVADVANGLIRKIAPDRTVLTVAGRARVRGSAEGTGDAAEFYNPSGIAVNAQGRLYVADADNHAIRTGQDACPDQPACGPGQGLVGQPRPLDTFPQTATNWLWRLVRRPAGSLAGWPGATERNSSLIPDTADLYVFRVEMTDPLGRFTARRLEFQAVTASPAGLPLRFSGGLPGLAVSNGLFLAWLSGSNSPVAAIEVSEDLARWTTVQTNIVPAAGLPLALPAAPGPSRFYRARYWP